MCRSLMAPVFALAIALVPIIARGAPEDTLRIGLREDPDLLDPIDTRTGRIS